MWLASNRPIITRDESLVIVGAASKWGPYKDEIEATGAAAEMIQRVRPDWTAEQAQVALAIGYAESRFGVTPDWQMPDGSPSWNWGATVAKGTRGYIPHADHTADNKPVTYQFAAFNTQDEGFDFWASRFPKAALAAAAEGNATGVSEGMYAACWFSGTCPPDCSDDARIKRYGQVIVGANKHTIEMLNKGDFEAEPLLKLGARVGLPLGNCPWHDGYKPGAKVPGSGGGGPSGGSKPAPTLPSTGSDAGDIGLGLGLLAGAIAIPIFMGGK